MNCVICFDAPQKQYEYQIYDKQRMSKKNKRIAIWTFMMRRRIRKINNVSSSNAAPHLKLHYSNAAPHRMIKCGAAFSWHDHFTHLPAMPQTRREGWRYLSLFARTARAISGGQRSSLAIKKYEYQIHEKPRMSNKTAALQYGNLWCGAALKTSIMSVHPMRLRIQNYILPMRLRIEWSNAAPHLCDMIATPTCLQCHKLGGNGGGTFLFLRGQHAQFRGGREHRTP